MTRGIHTHKREKKINSPTAPVATAITSTIGLGGYRVRGWERVVGHSRAGKQSRTMAWRCWVTVEHEVDDTPYELFIVYRDRGTFCQAGRVNSNGRASASRASPVNWIEATVTIVTSEKRARSHSQRNHSCTKLSHPQWWCVATITLHYLVGHRWNTGAIWWLKETAQYWHTHKHTRKRNKNNVSHSQTHKRKVTLYYTSHTHTHTLFPKIFMRNHVKKKKKSK